MKRPDTECKLCGTRTLLTIDAPDGRYYHCPQCELIFADAGAIPDPEKERRRYLEHDNSHENKGYVAMFERFIARVVAPYVSGRADVLEFGCGPVPVLADLLAARGFAVDVYDPFFYPQPLDEEKPYDLITATEVFEHLQTPFETIKHLKTRLKTNGWLAVMTLFHPGPYEFADWWYKRDLTHICFYNSRTLDWIAEHFGLRLVFQNGKNYALFQNTEGITDLCSFL